MGNAQQHATAAQMKAVASDGEATFVVNVGDNFYKNGDTVQLGEAQGGVTNLSDPLWKLYFEDVYNGSLKDMVFLTVLGNHGEEVMFHVLMACLLSFSWSLSLSLLTLWWIWSCSLFFYVVCWLLCVGLYLFNACLFSDYCARTNFTTSHTLGRG